MALPVRVTSVGEFGALLTTRRTPTLGPGAPVARKWTVMEQVPPGARDTLLQPLLSTVKLVEPRIDTAPGPMTSGAVPVLRIVTVRLTPRTPRMPRRLLPKSTLVALGVAEGVGATPVPLRPMVWLLPGTPLELLANTRLPLRVPVATGVNRTPTVQLLPAARV